MRDTSALSAAVTTGPIDGSSKHYVDVDGLSVPFRRVHLSTGDHLDLYDSSGPPYTDENARTDLDAGLPPVRTGWSRPPAPPPNTVGPCGCRHRRDAVLRCPRRRGS